MSYKIHMQGYEEPRTLFQVDALHAWRHGEFFAPVLVEVSPTGACNQNCRFCYSDKIATKDQKIATPLLTRLFTELPQLGTKAVLLQGTGEPLMHGGLADAVTAGAERGLEFCLTTTGVVLTDKVQGRMLPHLTFVKFSVLDSDPARYSAMHGCPDKQWTQLIANIGHAVARREREGLDVALTGTVYVELNNFAAIHEIVRFFKELGLDYVMVQEATYTQFTPAQQARNSSTHFSPEQIAEMTAKVMALNDENFRVKVRYPTNDASYHVGIYSHCWKDDFCQGIKFFPLVAADGNVYSCFRTWGKPEFSLGSLNEYSFEEIWRSARRAEIERRIMSTPPSGDDCAICGISKLNDILEKFGQKNKWRNFLI